MTLAQVVYQISTDGDFAARMHSDPEGALAEKGFKLSADELSSLLSVFKREMREIGELIYKAGGWN